MPTIKKPRKVNPIEPMMPTKYKVGERVYGIRSPNCYSGVLVDCYVTINTNRSGTYRNPGYVVKCDCDGRERKFQSIKYQTHGQYRQH